MPEKNIFGRELQSKRALELDVLSLLDPNTVKLIEQNPPTPFLFGGKRYSLSDRIFKGMPVSPVEEIEDVFTVFTPVLQGCLAVGSAVESIVERVQAIGHQSRTRALFLESSSVRWNDAKNHSKHMLLGHADEEGEDPSRTSIIIAPILSADASLRLLGQATGAILKTSPLYYPVMWFPALIGASIELHRDKDLTKSAAKEILYTWLIPELRSGNTARIYGLIGLTYIGLVQNMGGDAIKNVELFIENNINSIVNFLANLPF